MPGITRKERPMHKTKNDLPEKVRIQVAALLQERLAEAIDFEAQAKQAHWNVKGPDFIALHKLFDEVYEHAGEAVDLIAERIVQLGGVAEGTVKAVAKRSQMPDYPLTISSGREHVEALSRAIAWFGESIRKSIDQADEVNDKDTADIFTEVSRALDKDLWFVEAHLQAER
ncbi:MAG TPA: DNA starvation/stationary phase protection protein Dps [Candidatus Polarisedimenticolia bacterium]|nr:DNA starvation/stationary phase protection protein Dps [Candidatus Polarisedimenticolia bacterium]